MASLNRVVALVLVALTVSLRHLIVSAQPQYGDVRLVNEIEYEPGLYTVGIPEIYLNEEWGTIHIPDPGRFESFAPGAGQIMCKQLGAGDGREYNYSRNELRLNITLVEDDVLVALFVNQFCPDQNQYAVEAWSHILRCGHSPPLNQNHTKDLMVECNYWYKLYKAGYDTQVRLHWAGSETNSSGFVEVYLNNAWGPVCNLGQYEADTVCRQLGYTYAAGHGSSDSPDFVAESAKLDNFTCSLNSSNCLRHCFTYPPPDYNASCSSFSWVNCSFDEAKSNTSTAGFYDRCSFSVEPFPTPHTFPTRHPPSPHTLLIMLTVAGVLVLLSVAVTMLCCCCCLPGCVLHKQRRRKDYNPLPNMPPIVDDYEDFNQMH